MNAAQMVYGYDEITANKMRAELKKAIALRPDYPESYSLLAFVNLVTGADLDESVKLLRQVLTTSPGRSDLLYVLAQVYMRQEDFKTARQLLERLAQNKNDDATAQKAK